MHNRRCYPAVMPVSPGSPLPPGVASSLAVRVVFRSDAVSRACVVGCVRRSPARSWLCGIRATAIEGCRGRGRRRRRCGRTPYPPRCIRGRGWRPGICRVRVLGRRPCAAPSRRAAGTACRWCTSARVGSRRAWHPPLSPPSWSACRCSPALHIYSNYITIDISTKERR